MSKYNLIDILEGMSDEEWNDAIEADNLENHPDKENLKKIQALIRREKSIQKSRPGYHPDGSPKSNAEMGEDELEDFYLNGDTIDESWEPKTFTVMGKTNQSKYQGSTNNIEDFFQAIDNLPDTIKDIKVPLNTRLHKSNKDYKVITPTPGFQDEVKSIINSVVSEYNDNGEDITTFSLNSFTGGNNEDSASYYVQLETEKSNEFSDKMGKGEFGSLDEDESLKNHFKRFLKDYI